MAIYRVKLEMDAKGMTREDFIECLLNMHYKDWKHHVVHLTDTEEAIEIKREELRQVRNEAEIMGWTKELNLLDAQLIDEIDKLEYSKWEEEE